MPWKALVYLAGECNYGGRVTDERDRRTLMSLLSIVYTPQILDEDYKFCSNEAYRAPPKGSYDSYLLFIKSLPLTQGPEVYGLHENADIAKDLSDTNLMISSVLSTQDKISSGSGGTSQDEICREIASDILSKLPANFDLAQAKEKYPVKYEESMNTVLVQELVRFNRLLNVIRSSLQQVLKALKGQVVMSRDLEDVALGLSLGRLPEMWSSKSYPSLKNLAGYVLDFIARLKFFQKWLDEGIPAVFWISGFYFTQSFLSGTLQNFARKYSLPIDLLTMEFQVMSKSDFKTGPDDGVYISGMYLEGARWDSTTNFIGESIPKQLTEALPIVHVKPILMANKQLQKEKPSAIQTYDCPVYKTQMRRGTLSTTGHSTNYVINIELPSNKPPQHWVNRGVAVVLSLTDS